MTGKRVNDRRGAGHFLALAGSLILLGACLAACTTTYKADEAAASSPAMSSDEAHSVIQAWMSPTGARAHPVSLFHRQNPRVQVAAVRITGRNLVVRTTGGETLVYPLRSLLGADANVFCSDNPQGNYIEACMFHLGARRKPGMGDSGGDVFMREGNGETDVALSKRLVQAFVVLGKEPDAAALAQEQARFESAVRAYREGASKPQKPESVLRLQVQAEAAVRDKSFAEAEDDFAQALAIAPWWPEGHYNRALVLAETGDYALAITEMTRYLQLVPDTPNAREAQNFIYEWQRKAS
jgi:tetratricopeptide (TPR) repeat protein